MIMADNWKWMVGAAAAVLVAAAGFQGWSGAHRTVTAPMVSSNVDLNRQMIIDVPVTVGNAPPVTLRMAVDTGARLTQLATPGIRKLDLRFTAPDTQVAYTIDDRQERLLWIPELTIAGVEMQDFTIATCGDCQRIDGVLGLNALERMSVQIDTAHRTVDLAPLATPAADLKKTLRPWLKLQMRRKPMGNDTPGIRLAFRNRSPVTLSEVTVLADCARQHPVTFFNVRPGERRTTEFAAPDGKRCIYRGAELVDVRR